MTAAPSFQKAASKADAERPRSRQQKLGPSAVGGCRRQAAYIVAGTPPSDDVESGMAAVLGTYIHEGALKVLAAEYGGVEEVAVESDVLKGSADLVYLDGVVEDLKTNGYFAFTWQQNRGVSLAHLFQVHLYAWHLREGYFDQETRARLGVDRLDIHTVRIRYVSRDNGDEWSHEQPYDPDITAQALAWLADVLEIVFDLGGPDGAPRDHDGPGLSIICDGCKWLTACWGPERADGRDRQASLIRDDQDVADALDEYARGRTLEKEGKELKQLARAKLTASDAGQYGGFKLGWSEEKEIERPDMDKVRDLFARAGLEMPMKVGAPSRTISVIPARGVIEAGPKATPLT